MLVWNALAGAAWLGSHAVPASLVARAAEQEGLVGLASRYSPGGSVEHLAVALAGDGARLALAVLGGRALAVIMHACRLHWSWSAGALAGGLLLATSGLGRALRWLPVVGGLGTSALLLALGVAAARGHRLQLGEADGRGSWAGMHGPLTPIESLAALRDRLGRLLGGTRPGAGSELLIGRVAGGRRPAHIAASHTVVLGATGSGKTVTLRRLLQRASTTMGIVAVDGKGDPALERDLERFALTHGRRFVAWSPRRETRYSPFSHGSETEIVDKALAAESFGDDYYLRLGQRFLGFAVRALRAAGRQPSLRELARYVDPENLEQLAAAMEAHTPGSWGRLLADMPTLDRGERQAIAGTQHRLAAMAESDIGALLEPDPGHETIDLLEVIERGDVAYFNLSADSRPELSKMLGAAIVTDLLSIEAAMQQGRRHAPTVLLFDDVQAFATPAAMRGIASLSARGREPGMMLLLGTQSLADLDVGPGRGVGDQLLDNRANLIVHRLPGHNSALRASRELGDHDEHRIAERLAGEPGAWRIAGSGTRSLVSVPNVPPRELMRLATGMAVIGTPLGPPLLVRILPPD